MVEHFVGLCIEEVNLKNGDKLHRIQVYSLEFHYLEYVYISKEIYLNLAQSFTLGMDLTQYLGKRLKSDGKPGLVFVG